MTVEQRYRITAPCRTLHPDSSAWTAFDERLRRPVRIVVFAGGVDPGRRSRDLLTALDRVRHPALETLYDAGETFEWPCRGRMFVVLPPLSGIELGATPSNRTNVVELVGEASSALAQLHEHGLCHGRLNTDSIRVSPVGTDANQGLTLSLPEAGFALLDSGACPEPADDIRDLGLVGLRRLAERSDRSRREKALRSLLRAMIDPVAVCRPTAAQVSQELRVSPALRPLAEQVVRPVRTYAPVHGRTRVAPRSRLGLKQPELRGVRPAPSLVD